MNFTPDTLEKMRKELDSVLSNYGVSKNVQFKLGKIRYSENTFTATLEAFSTDSGQSGEQVAFGINAPKVGVPTDWYGRKVLIDGVAFTVAAINTRARKYPIELRNVETGKVERKSSIELVRSRMV